jgi:hypothetical protein
VPADDQSWLTELAVKYKMLESTSERLASGAFPELLTRGRMQHAAPPHWSCLRLPILRPRLGVTMLYVCDAMALHLRQRRSLRSSELCGATERATQHR